MWLFEQKGIYIHIPKTGGSSIRRALQRLPNTVDCGHFNLIQHEEKLLEGYSETDMKTSVGVFNDYTTFTIVRNPWDRMVSEWKWFTNTTYKKPRVCVKAAFNGMGFEEFIDSFLYGGPCGDHRHRKPQASFVHNRDNSTAQYIFRFENINEEFVKICDLLKIPHMKLGHELKTCREHYSIYYNTETKKQVEKVWGIDIDMFKYTF